MDDRIIICRWSDNHLRIRNQPFFRPHLRLAMHRVSMYAAMLYGAML